MTLADHQQSYRGLTLGVGTGIRLFQVDGLEDLDVRDGDRDAPRDHGGIPGSHFAAQKVFVLTYRISEDLEDELAAFYQAFTVRETTQDEFIFKFPDQPERMVRARPIRRVRPRTRVGTVAGAVEIIVAMKTTDPRIYSTTEETELIPIFVLSEEGFELPVVNLPINMAAQTGLTATVENTGGADAYPLLQFQYPSGGAGTVTGLLLTNTSNGSSFEMGADPSGGAFALVAGQTLIADMDSIARKAPDVIPIRIAAASRYTNWQFPRQPFYLSPGTNVLNFEVVGTSVDTLATITWRATDL